ncbi:Cna protein B-type domain protein [Stieleria maiorica]|uniref:Cna protein B-type domain protein n=1 Tax=Stieleria maiorica TaxID=2795974 RepID=A0A5B9ME11_9BACT|nr:carboxypeptidase-like regulatory domain-containing protein [Stieleria maiorica]QEF99511.1 Cna protein B-type domain protein [Stieleria maiorica]
MHRLICFMATLALLGSSGFVSAADVAEQQWVRVSESGSVQGRVIVPRSEGISAARGAKVLLIDQFGKTAGASTESDKTGRFTLADVKPGVYTLMIRGEGVFACCAMHVVSSNVPIGDHFEIAAGAVEFSVVRNAILRYMPSGQATKVEFDPSSNPMASGRAFTGESVRLSQYEGGLRGRLTRAGFTENLGARAANVVIFRDGVEVARTLTDESGNFHVADLEPGSYSILGSGKDGFGLMGIELVNPLMTQTALGESGDATTLVTQTESGSDTFIMQVAPGPITVIEDRLVSEEEEDRGLVVPLEGGYDPTAMGGSFGGGGGGGGAGGGIGGGGRLGRLAVLGGIGAAIAIGASDDSDAVVPPPVVSPAEPAQVQAANP